MSFNFVQFHKKGGGFILDICSAKSGLGLSKNRFEWTTGIMYSTYLKLSLTFHLVF